MPHALLLVENASVPSDPRVWPECLTLLQAGWDITVICPRGHSRDTHSNETVDGISIHRFTPAQHEGGFRGYVAEYAKALWEIRRLVRRLAARERFDVVHAATPPDFLLLAARGLRARGAATILDHHDLSPELFAAKFGPRPLARKALLVAERIGFRLADVVIAPNDSFRAVAIGRGGVRPENVFVVRNGPDPDVFRPVPPDPGLREKAPHLLGYVGLMGSQDGVIEAIDALAILSRRRSDWHAIFVGEGDVLPEARARVEAAALQGFVTFLGFVSDRQRLVEIIASCDVCLSPEPRNALNESSTLIKVAEYMAVGRPVVAFDLRESIATAGAGAVFAADGEGWATAIDELLDDPARRERMGAEGRARVVDRFSWSQSQPVLLAAYDRALRVAGDRRGASGDR